MTNLDFEAVESVECNDERATIRAKTGSGQATVTLPIADLMRAAMLMIQASQTIPWRQDRTLHAIEAKGLRVYDDPKNATVQLVISLQTGSSPLAISVPREGLRDLALGFLETAGVLRSEKDGRSQ